MGLIARLLGGADATRAIAQVAEIFTPNETRALELHAEMRHAAMAAMAAEFDAVRAGVFDRIVNAMNRLPRPILAFGTLGLFVYAMVDPVGFSMRMRGLDAVPEPLWWLLGAIVSFYFGARELHYFRRRVPRRGVRRTAGSAEDTEPNAAISAWQNGQGYSTPPNA